MRSGACCRAHAVHCRHLYHGRWSNCPTCAIQPTGWRVLFFFSRRAIRSPACRKPSVAAFHLAGDGGDGRLNEPWNNTVNVTEWKYVRRGGRRESGTANWHCWQYSAGNGSRWNGWQAITCCRQPVSVAHYVIIAHSPCGVVSALEVESISTKPTTNREEPRLSGGNAWQRDR